MNTFNGITYRYLCHYNRLFWLFFLIAAAIFIITASTSLLDIFYLEAVIGLLLVVAGINRIGDEFFNRRIKEAHDDSVRTINELLQWAEKSYDYTRAFKDKHEKRLFRLDHKRIEHTEKIDEQFRAAVKKILKMDNNLGKTLRALNQEKAVLEKEKKNITRLDKLTRDVLRERSFIERKVLELNNNQFRALQHIRDTGMITNKDYRIRFRVSDKGAYNELMALVQKGLIKRAGKGRTTHYVLAF